jgi:polar amino acid transport system substrate-binding protein
MNELTPTGKLRVGLVSAPALSALFVVKDKDAAPRGVPVDLANELARQLGVEAEFMVAPNTGELTDALASGEIDVSFMPVDDERRKRIEFGPIYFLVESTYLATEASGIRTAEEVDRPGVRVVGIANTTTIRAATRTLKHTTIKAMQSVGEAVAMLASGKADAFALSRDSLPPFAKMLPGSRITTGGFQLTGIAIAVPKGRPAALAMVTKFMDKAKHFGVVRRALDRAGFPNEPVAP